MNIDDYIRATKRNIYALNPSCLEDEMILNHLSELASNINSSIIVKPIFSTSIFPEIVNFKETTYLLWDMHFWNIYETIIKTNFLLYETDITEASQSIASSNAFKYATDQYRIILLDILTSKLERHPKVAYRLAQEQFFYRELAKRDSNPFEYSFNIQRSQEITSTILLAKLFVFLHEMHHEYLKSDKKYRSDAIELQQEVADILMKNIDFSKTNANSRTIETLKMQAYKDKTTLEESTCDLCAFKLAYKYVAMIMPDLNFHKTFEWLYNAFATCIYFVEIVNHLELFWDNAIKQFYNYYSGGNFNLDNIYSEIKVYEAEMQNRLSFLSFAIYASMVHTGIDISQDLFSKGEKMARYISTFSQSFLDLKFLAEINYDAQNLKTKKNSPNDFFESINLLLGNPYE